MMSKWILAVSAMVLTHSVEASVFHAENKQQIRKVRIADEAVIAMKSSRSFKSIEELTVQPEYSELAKVLSDGEASLIFSRPKKNGYRILIEWKAKNSRALRDQAGLLEKLSYIEWVNPNYRYEGEAREFVRINDPMFSKQLHHGVLQSKMAWMFGMGREEIVVAVTDDGVDLDHEDLQANIWVNKDEIPGNGIDDDGNGYIDDVNGWDFSAGDNDPRPGKSFFGAVDSHGTHVAGIIAASANGNGLIGTAPKVKIMPIRFAGSGAWTSSVIAKSYAYAVDNGARIISTSYNIDGMSYDLVFQESIAYVYENQVLHFNSAGNGQEENPSRQKLEELILVCSTHVSPSMRDRKSDFSNWGTGIDMCAPGSDIWSTMPKNSYARMSGTSMAAPNAAAVAALIWSIHPSWTRDQVAAQLFATAENIDPLNEMFAGQLGAGRVNSFRSIALKAPAPRIDGVEVLKIENEVIGLRVYSKNVFRSDTVENLNNWILRGDTEEGLINIPLKLDRKYKIGTNEFVLELERSLPTGTYEFIARSGGIRDPFHQALDGDSDGLAGGDYVFEFEIEFEDLLSPDELHAKSGS